MSRTVIPDLTEVLKGTEFEDKTENYKKFFDQAKIVTILDLENCPRYAGPRLCGHSTHAFIQHVREYTLNPPEPEPKPKRVYKKKTKSEEVISEPEPEMEPADDILLEEDAHITEEGD
jgi:hypothetical protein